MSNNWICTLPHLPIAGHSNNPNRMIAFDSKDFFVQFHNSAQINIDVSVATLRIQTCSDLKRCSRFYLKCNRLQLSTNYKVMHEEELTSNALSVCIHCYKVEQHTFSPQIRLMRFTKLDSSSADLGRLVWFC
jgi:hypothetical protein